LIVLQTHSFWFYAPLKSDLAAGAKSHVLEKMSPDEFLQEAFAPRKIARDMPSFSPQKESMVQQFKEHPIAQNQSVPVSFADLPKIESVSTDPASFPVYSFQLPSSEQFNFFADLPKDLILPTPKKERVSFSFQPKLELVIRELSALPTIAKPIAVDAKIAFVEGLESPVHIEAPIARVVPSIPVPNLPHLPSLAELETINLSDSFDSELAFLPRTDGHGYIFALTLIPRTELNIPKIRQNVVFLIDRSNSIQKERLQATKHAISRALEELDSDVRFNVIAFDSKIDKLFPSLTPHTSDARAKANRFLEHIALGSLFSVGDLHKALFLTIPGQVQDDEMYTAVLLTDGESLSKKNVQRTLFRDWTLQNAGRVSLYAIGLVGDQNLAALDATCAINQGKLISSTTNRGLKRKLEKLAKNIRSPIAKGISSKAVAKGNGGRIEVHLNPGNSPHLYVDEPYVILGSTETLDDFILFVQARLKNGWLNIKKPISFADARKGGESLQSQWALQNAYHQYELYIADENPSHLIEARKLLEPFDIQAIQ
jgi:hypothetical protein